MLGQLEIAERIVKDQASIARIMTLLEKKELLVQTTGQPDRRRVDRPVTPKQDTT